MSSDLMLGRKLTLRCGSRKLVLRKKENERIEHVLMKAFLWSLYLPEYDNLLVEYEVDDRYKPDVIALDHQREPLFWGEAGKVGTEKLRALLRRYPRTHFAIAKWGTRLQPYIDIAEEILAERPRSAPFDLINFPSDSGERFIGQAGEIAVSRNHIELIRLNG